MLTPIELGKAKLALYSPEFISLTAKLTFVETTDIPTAGTDGRRVLYNPDFVASLTNKQVIGLILHEVGHNMLAHPARVGQRDKRLANIAMDIVLNQTLQAYFDETRSTLGAEMPPDGVYGPKYDKYKGWNWEKVYAELQNKTNPDNTPQFDYVEPGKNEDGSVMTPSQCENLAREWTMAAQQAATMAKQRGIQSGMFRDFVQGMIKTKVDWHAQLWDVFTKEAKDDQSFRRFNRKFIHAETYLPGMYSERIGAVGFFVDTSGSVSTEEFKVALGAMNEILDSLKPDKIVFGCCDTQMQSVEELTCDELPIVAKTFKGRGGTVLTPIFQYIEKLDEPLELVVVLTDGEFEHDIAKTLEPECGVIWLITSGSTQAAESAFGRVIQVEV